MANRQTDILIVGGGVVGWSAAHQLRARGRDVTIVDASPRFGTSCSFDNAGQLVPSHMKPLCVPGVVGQALRWMLDSTSPFKLHLRPDVALLRWLWTFWRHCNPRHLAACIPLLARLQLENRRLLAELVASGGIDCHLQTRGLLLLSRDVDAEQQRELVVEAVAQGMRATPCKSNEDLQRFDPAMSHGAAAGGVFYEDDAHLDPGRFVHGLAELCQRSGVEFVGATEVSRLQLSGRRVTGVQTSDGEFRANDVVLAAGSWTPALAKTVGLRVPIQPGKGYSLTIPMPEHGPTLPLILGDDRVVVTPLDGRLRISGTMEIGARDVAIDERRTGAILDTFRRWFPDAAIPERDAIEVWAGLRPCTPDGLPMIGRSKRFENLSVAAGHAMLGVSMAAITGQLVADAVEGVPARGGLELLSPDRFS